MKHGVDNPFANDRDAKALFLDEYFEGQALVREFAAERAAEESHRLQEEAHWLRSMALDCALSADPRVDLDRFSKLARRMESEGGWSHGALDDFLNVYIPEVS